MPKPNLPPVFLDRPPSISMRMGPLLRIASRMKARILSIGSRLMLKKSNASSRREHYDLFSSKTSQQANGRHTSTPFVAKNCATQVLLSSVREPPLAVTKSITRLTPLR
jgi:hypothetical protein